ncbi:MAG TPA: hypothetical protein VKP30_30610 [Polyangiaceae bacterium]|nr:hypothetical protein [Polyangiaceae bacterium]
MTNPTSPKKKQVAVTPIMVSQATSLEVLGIPGQRWPDYVRSIGIPHRRVGQLTIAKVEDCLRVLAPESTHVAVPADPAETVRAALGLTRRGAR